LKDFWVRARRVIGSGLALNLIEEEIMGPNMPPEWMRKLKHHNPEFASMVESMSKRVLKDGAIPAKYKILMTMIVDAIMAHAEGCASLANRARSAGASEAEINEAIEVAYLFGGTPALVTAINALSPEKT
jgi:alkylhydroperoxidase/carboxymuconolactone decarboxylase family protein YurZ